MISVPSSCSRAAAAVHAASCDHADRGTGGCDGSCATAGIIQGTRPGVPQRRIAGNPLRSPPRSSAARTDTQAATRSAHGPAGHRTHRPPRAEWSTGRPVSRARERLARVVTHPNSQQLLDPSLNLRRRRYGTCHGVGLLNRLAGHEETSVNGIACCAMTHRGRMAGDRFAPPAAGGLTCGSQACASRKREPGWTETRDHHASSNRGRRRTAFAPARTSTWSGIASSSRPFVSVTTHRTNMNDSTANPA